MESSALFFFILSLNKVQGLIDFRVWKMLRM